MGGFYIAKISHIVYNKLIKGGVLMYPQKEKIQMMLTIQIVSIVAWFFIAIFLIEVRNMVLLAILIAAAMIAFNAWLQWKFIVCPNCGSNSLFFAKHVVEYYSRYEYNQNRRQKPPECPHCGKTYGEYNK